MCWEGAIEMIKLMNIATFLKETGTYKPQRDARIRQKISEGCKRNWVKRHEANRIHIET